VPLNAKGRDVTSLPVIAAPQHAAIRHRDVRDAAPRRFRIANCSFIKIDVEGHEEAVLDGARALIAAQRPMLMIELDEGFNPGVVAALAARYAVELSRLFLSRGDAAAQSPNSTPRQRSG
jgi:hypothetical protein